MSPTLQPNGLVAFRVGAGICGVVAVTTMSAFFLRSSKLTSPKMLKKSLLTVGSLATTSGAPSILVRSPLLAPVVVALRMPAWSAPLVQFGSALPRESLSQPLGMESRPVTWNAFPLNVIGLVTVTAALALALTKLRRARVATVLRASSFPARSRRVPRLVSRNRLLLSRVVVTEYLRSFRLFSFPVVGGSVKPFGMLLLTY